LSKREEIREKALGELQKHHVLMLDGHFDFGNGYHGRVYLNRISCSVSRPSSGASRRI
jgi:hypothetical protein